MPGVFAAGDVAMTHYPFYGRRIRVEHWANALHQGPVAARNMLGRSEAYDRVPYFFSDQYDVGMEYAGYARTWDRVVFRGDPASREFIAFWLLGDRVVAGMNVNVWDVTDQIQRLIRARVRRRRPAPRRPRRPARGPRPRHGSGRGMNRLEQLHDAGVSIWLDTLSRELLDSGAFATLIADCAVTGATSNPTIFAKAITGSDRYDDQLRAAVASGVRDPQELFFELALDDVRRAADLLRPAYEASDGRDGFVSFECTPDLADDTAATVEQAVELWNRLARPNVMIKVPATEAGVPAIEELTARGVNVNVTLLFSVARYEQVIDAYVAGLERRVAAGQPVDAIASVASFFVSRVDAKADALLPAGSDLRGRVAIANARRAYGRYRDRFADERWLALRDAGARPQRPLWASTGTKDPAYSDVLYVEQLIAPDVINTMPEATLRAFADHGDATRGFGASTGAETLEPRRGRGRSTSPPSPRSSSARACARSATPTRSCSTASRPSSSEPRRPARRDHDAAGSSKRARPTAGADRRRRGRGAGDAAGAARAGRRSRRHHDRRARAEVHQPLDGRRSAVQASAHARRQAAGHGGRARRSLAPRSA